MKVLAVSIGMLAFAATLGLVTAQDQPAREPEAARGVQPAAPKERESDVRAITDLLASFVEAFNAKDAKAIGDLFTPDAEIEDEDGEITRGRDAIVERFTGTFAEKNVGTLAVAADSLRFLGADLAIEEGTATLSTGPDAPPLTNRYSVIYARQGGRWLHARIRDEPSEEVTPHERLLELEWMLGEWVNESDEGVVFTTCTVGRQRQLPPPQVRPQGRRPHRPQRHPTHRLGRPAGAVPHVGLRRRRRVRRGLLHTGRR